MSPWDEEPEPPEDGDDWAEDPAEPDEAGPIDFGEDEEAGQSAEQDTRPADLRIPPEEPPALACPSLDVFVRDVFAPMYRRDVDNHQRERAWCAQWWRHPEAIGRLEAVWRAWEHLRLDGTTGLSVWFKDHLDPHMAVLMDPTGPFKGCSELAHAMVPTPPLRLVEPPVGLFGLAGTDGDAAAAAVDVADFTDPASTAN